MGKILSQLDTTKKRIKISDLALLSGVSKSTVHHYLNIGLLHPPKKMGLSLSGYDWTHLSKLKQIRELRENKKLPLTKIKEVLSHQGVSSQSEDYGESEAETLISVLEEEKRITRARKSERKKVEIIDAAIVHFNKNGYEKTTLEAIAESLHMAKSTVYLYFESKEALFMECIGRLAMVAVPEEAWDEIRKERNALERLKKRGRAFHGAFPSYQGILTVTKTKLGGENRKLAEKARDMLSLMTAPIAKDIRRGMADGIFREIDDELLAYFILGMGENLGYRLMTDSRYTIEQGIEKMFDILTRGIAKQVVTEKPGLEKPICWGDVTDIKGVKTSVEKIQFGGLGYLPVKFGEADVQVSIEKIDKLKFIKQGPLLSAEITAKDDQIVTVDVDGTLTLEGETYLGRFSIRLNKVRMVLLDAIGSRKHEREMLC